jgi:hypothetical protein
MNQLFKIIILANIFLYGCNAYLKNVSPDNFKPRTTEKYKICAEVSAESLVLRNSIDANVTIDGTQHQMQGSGTGIWSYDHHAPAINSFDYYYDLKWKYLFAFFIPVSKQKRYPASGYYHSSVSMPAGCSSDGWCQMTSGTTKDIEDVWGSGPDNIFAVATADSFLHFDGLSWSIQTSTAPDISVNAVWGSGRTYMVFAVGWAGAIYTHTEPSTHWTVRWSGSDPSNTEGIYSGELLEIWGFGPDESSPYDASDIFIVSGQGKISHFDGVHWNFQNSGTTNTLRSVWGSSPSDVFAVGASGTILHYDGASWNPQNSGTTEGLFAVWGSSPSDVFAVGGGGTILHYDGTSWNPQNSGTDIWLRDVWGYSPQDVYAVGNGGTILHYDGSGWSAQKSGTVKTLLGIWGTKDGCEPVVYAVGEYGLILQK